MTGTDGISHAELVAGVETPEKSQKLPVREAAVPITGKASCREYNMVSQGKADFGISL